MDGVQVVAACLDDASIASACEMASWSECASGIDVSSHASDGTLTVDTVADSSMATACASLPGVTLQVTVGVVVKVTSRESSPPPRAPMEARLAGCVRDTPFCTARTAPSPPRLEPTSASGTKVGFRLHLPDDPGSAPLSSMSLSVGPHVVSVSCTSVTVQRPYGEL